MKLALILAGLFLGILGVGLMLMRAAETSAAPIAPIAAPDERPAVTVAVQPPAPVAPAVAAAVPVVQAEPVAAAPEGALAEPLPPPEVPPSGAFDTIDSPEIKAAFDLIYKEGATQADWLAAIDVFVRCLKEHPGNTACERGQIEAETAIEQGHAGPVTAHNNGPPGQPIAAQPTGPQPILNRFDGVRARIPLRVPTDRVRPAPTTRPRVR